MALQMDDMIVGVLYGDRISANYKTIATTYPVYCGVEFGSISLETSLFTINSPRLSERWLRKKE